MNANTPARKLRIVFAGTPDFAAAHLQALIDANFNIVSAYSQPDRAFGRGKKLRPTPVKAVAQAHDIPVKQPPDFRDPAALTALADLKPDLMIVVAYGLLLPESVLAIPTLGCLNVHASLLPRWRGAAPIERAIMAGDTASGVCIMAMDKGLDTGPVLLRDSTLIGPEDTTASLGSRLQEMGCKLIVTAIDLLAEGKLNSEPQDNTQATYAGKIQKSEAAIDWQQDADTINRLVRGLFPRSPAWCSHQDQRLRIIQATPVETSTSAPAGTVLKVSTEGVMVACGAHSALLVTSVQPEGKGAMSVASLLNGHPDFFHPGQTLA
jgi:methionyl-tRNA formyltransferase